MSIGGRVATVEHFKDISDPRVDATKDHVLRGIIVKAVCAVICGADDWVEIEQCKVYPTVKTQKGASYQWVGFHLGKRSGLGFGRRVTGEDDWCCRTESSG